MESMAAVVVAAGWTSHGPCHRSRANVPAGPCTPAEASACLERHVLLRRNSRRRTRRPVVRLWQPVRVPVRSRTSIDFVASRLTFFSGSSGDDVCSRVSESGRDIAGPALIYGRPIRSGRRGELPRRAESRFAAGGCDRICEQRARGSNAAGPAIPACRLARDSSRVDWLRTVVAFRADRCQSIGDGVGAVRAGAMTGPGLTPATF